MRSPHVHVTVDLDRVREAAETIRARTGVRLIAVIKADAYGLGAMRVADTLAAVVDEFAYFSADEARVVGRPGLVLGPPIGDPQEFRELKLRPTIGNVAAAERFAGLPVAISVDVGMRRFACPPDELDDVARRCDVEDYYAHAVTVDGASRLRDLCGGRGRPLHAAASDLLEHPECWFDAVRPGLALYDRALRVTSRLEVVRNTGGPAGYTRFECPQVGIILAGYSNYIQPGPIMINGHPQRVLEAGMNTSFVTVDAEDRAGDEVVLLGDELSVPVLAEDHKCRQHEILCRYASMGLRHYVGPGETVAT